MVLCPARPALLGLVVDSCSAHTKVVGAAARCAQTVVQTSECDECFVPASASRASQVECTTPRAATLALGRGCRQLAMASQQTVGFCHED